MGGMKTAATGKGLAEDFCLKTADGKRSLRGRGVNRGTYKPEAAKGASHGKDRGRKRLDLHGSIREK